MYNGDGETKWTGRCRQTRTKIVEQKHGGQCNGQSNKNCKVERCPTKG